MTRLQALEAVAEAALGVSRLWGRGLSDIGGLRRALAALNALPADPAPAQVVGMGTVIQIASAFDTDPQGIYGAHVVTTALCADGSVWMRRDGVGTPGEWACLPLTGDGA